MNKKSYILSVVATVLVFAVCFVFAGCEDEITPQDIANKTMQALWVDKNADKALELVNDDMLKVAGEEADMSVDEYKKAVQSTLEQTHLQFSNTYPDWSVQWNVSKVREANEFEVTDFNDYYKTSYGLDLNVEQINYVTVDITINSKTGSQKSADEMVMYKIDGSWYLDLEYLDYE